MSRSVLWLILSAILALAACSPVSTAKVRPDDLVFSPLQLVVPEIEPVVLPNGVRLYLAEDRELPLIRLTGMVGIGSINDPAAREGQSALFAALLEDGGAGARGPIALEEYLEDLAINFSVGIDSYATTINLSMLSEDLDAGLTILDDVLRRPQFNSDRLKLLRRQSIEALRRQNDSPQSIASRAFNAAVYGDHPFGRTPTIATVNTVERKHLVDFHDKHFVPENFWLAISGDFDKQVMTQRIRALLADWEKRDYESTTIPALPDMPDPAIWLADKDIPQTTVMIGGVGISKDNPDMLPVRVMNAILGGSGFNSRLMREIRSNRGLAYSVYSYYMIGRRLPGSFIASGESKNASAMLMTTLMLDEMATIRTELVSEEELKLAKESRVNSFVFAFTDSHDVLTQQMRLDYYGYPEGYLQTYREKVMAITREDVLRVAKEYLRPEKMAIVLVGRPDGYAAVAEELQLPIQVVPQVDITGEAE